MHEHAPSSVPDSEQPPKRLKLSEMIELAKTDPTILEEGEKIAEANNQRALNRVHKQWKKPEKTTGSSHAAHTHDALKAIEDREDDRKTGTHS